jgi:WhiB family redox-sensing transcriptional regulator
MAECLRRDPRIFMPHAQMSKVPQDHKDCMRAIEICKRCPVQTECRAYALEHGPDGMIWGGLVPREINRIRRARKMA